MVSWKITAAVRLCSDQLYLISLLVRSGILMVTVIIF